MDIDKKDRQISAGSTFVPIFVFHFNDIPVLPNMPDTLQCVLLDVLNYNCISFSLFTLCPSLSITKWLIPIIFRNKCFDWWAGSRSRVHFTSFWKMVITIETSPSRNAMAVMQFLVQNCGSPFSYKLNIHYFEDEKWIFGTLVIMSRRVSTWEYIIKR